MDIGSLSDQELLNFIFLLAFGAVVFASVFFAGLVFYVRSKRAANKRTSAGTPKRAPSPSAGDSEETMGSLLKAMSRKSRLSSFEIETSAGRPSPTPSAPLQVEAYRELLRVLVVPSGQKIVVEVDGKRYETIGQIKDRTIGRRILETVAALLKFTGGYIATAGGVKILPAPDVRLTVLPAEAALTSSPVASPSLSPTLATAGEATASPPVASSSPAQQFLADMEAAARDLQGKPEPVEKGAFWRATLNRKGKPDAPPEAPGFNLAEEIDEIVQRKLQQANAQTRVKIHAGAGGMVRIQVADKFYESVDQVEDPAVRTLIKSAIEEWNR